MKKLKSNLIILGSVGLLLLTACSNNNQAANPETSPSISTPIAATSPTIKTEAQHGESHGGQVVETDAYHLEFVPEKEAKGTHLDFYLQKGDNHEAISNAKVTAQVQLPDGTQKTLPFVYDNKGKHYTSLLPGNATGQYQVKVTSVINGEKVDGRFSFSK